MNLEMQKARDMRIKKEIQGNFQEPCELSLLTTTVDFPSTNPPFVCPHYLMRECPTLQGRVLVLRMDCSTIVPSV